MSDDMIGKLHKIFKNSMNMKNNMKSGGSSSIFMGTMDYLQNISREILDCHDQKIPVPLREHYKMLIVQRSPMVGEMKAMITLYHQSYDKLNFYKNILQFLVSFVSSKSVHFIPLDRGINSVDITVDDVFNCMAHTLQTENNPYDSSSVEHPLVRLSRTMMFEALREYAGNSNRNLFKEQSKYDATDFQLLNHYVVTATTNNTNSENSDERRETNAAKRFKNDPIVLPPPPPKTTSFTNYNVATAAPSTSKFIPQDNVLSRYQTQPISKGVEVAVSPVTTTAAAVFTTPVEVHHQNDLKPGRVTYFEKEEDDCFTDEEIRSMSIEIEKNLNEYEMNDEKREKQVTLSEEINFEVEKEDEDDEDEEEDEELSRALDSFMNSENSN